MIRIIILIDFLNKNNYHSHAREGIRFLANYFNGVKSIMNSFISKLMMLFMALILAGCGSGDNPPPDADGDGVEDSLAAFPNDPTETDDTDGDGVMMMGTMMMVVVVVLLMTLMELLLLGAVWPA